MDDDIEINGFSDSNVNGKSIFPQMTHDDVIILRTWDENQLVTYGRYCSLNAEDLWLITQIKRAYSKKEAARFAAKLAGLE